ncbi:MAG TPA: hypothetical protein VMH81_21710 [Bryobacteraceae bacterium]|nr:hypothetical protein [Bryobacteraceae bacterium]
MAHESQTGAAPLPETGDHKSFFRHIPAPVAYLLTSLLLLVPCYWQPRIEGGDLTEYIYNSWTTRFLENGRLLGMTVVHRWSNILFDLMLSGLFRIFGAEAAQRIGISIVVLTFVWGAFAFVAVVSGRRSWHLMPCLAMLAYGWVFHMGFFDFHLSMGLCLWGMALAWEWKVRRLAAAAPVFLLACLAHALPVVWTLGLLAYVWVARDRTPFMRARMTVCFVAGLLVLHAAMGRKLSAQWSPSQLVRATGLDQVWVFDAKYYIVLMGLLVVWGVLFLTLVRRTGARQVVASLPFQLCILSAAGVSILPGSVLIPGFYHALGYIAERMSLGVAVCVCAMLATVQPRRTVQWALLLVAFIFFGFLYRDERLMNGFEDRMQNLTAQSAPCEFQATPAAELNRAVSLRP